MDKEKLERFAQAFSTGGGGFRRQCACGKTYYNPDGGWDYTAEEEQELKEMKATPLDCTVGTIIIEDQEYVWDCDCWRKHAEKVIKFLDSNTRRIARYLNGEKKHAQEVVAEMPTVKE